LEVVPGCPGFLRFRDGHVRRIFTVPGPAADASVGIAVGHFTAPLQMLVREAKAAEKRAKTAYGRGALAVSLYKRSGEIVEWGCKWDNGKDRVALELMRLGRLWLEQTAGRLEDFAKLFLVETFMNRHRGED
jgi:hypothetical protein